MIDNALMIADLDTRFCIKFVSLFQLTPTLFSCSLHIIRWTQLYRGYFRKPYLHWQAMNTPATFIELVELHERKWGTQAYPGRPSLQALMTAPIVALWTFKKRFIFSVHAKAQDLNDIVDNLVRAGEYFSPTSYTKYGYIMEGCHLI